jgi:hypothetical protein
LLYFVTLKISNIDPARATAPSKRTGRATGFLFVGFGIGFITLGVARALCGQVRQPCPEIRIYHDSAATGFFHKKAASLDLFKKKAAADADLFRDIVDGVSKFLWIVLHRHIPAGVRVDLREIDDSSGQKQTGLIQAFLFLATAGKAY